MSETGHAKNVANFSQIAIAAASFGANYTPGNSLIEAPNLQTRLTAFQNAMNAVFPKESAETLAVNERKTAYAPLGKLVTRVINAAAVSINDPLFSEDLRAVARKIQGSRAKSKIKDDPATPGIDESAQNISASQMSYDNRLAHFSRLIELLESNGSYAPNETELQIAALKAMRDNMQTKNTAAAVAAAEAKSARAARDAVLYDDTDGIIALANLVKKYTKSVFGADSPQYKQMSALQFRKVK